MKRPFNWIFMQKSIIYALRLTIPYFATKDMHFSEIKIGSYLKKLDFPNGFPMVP